MHKIQIPNVNKPQTGAFIKKLRKKFFLTQDDVAKKINVSRPTYNKIESGKTDVTLYQAKKLTEYFNVSLTDLLLAEDSVNTNIRSSLSSNDNLKNPQYYPESGLIKLRECILLIWEKLVGLKAFNEAHVQSLLFLIEYEHVLRFNKQIFGCKFVQKNGHPILLKYNIILEFLLENSKLEKIESNIYKFPNHKYLPLSEVQVSKFTSTEYSLIEQTILSIMVFGVRYLSRMLKDCIPLQETREESVVNINPQ